MNGQFPRSLAWKDEKGKLSKTRRHGIWSRAEQECFTATFFFLTSAAYLSQFLSFWVKCPSLLFIGLLLSPVFKMEALKTTRNSWRSMTADLLLVDGTWWWWKITRQRSTSNASEVPLHKCTSLPSSEVPLNFYSNSTYSVITLLLSPT